MTEEIRVKPNEPILTATSYLFDGATRILLANTLDGEKNPNKISLSFIRFEKKTFAECCLDILAEC